MFDGQAEGSALAAQAAYDAVEVERALDEGASLEDIEAGRRAAQSTTGESVLRGGLWNSLSRVLPQVYVVVQSVVAARFLGIDGMGQQSYISFVALTFGSVFGFGLSGSLVRSVGDAIGRGRQSAIRGLLSWAWRIVIIGAVLALITVGAFAIGQPDLREAWLLAAIGCSLSVLITVPTAVLGGLQRWREISVITLVLGGLSTAATVAVLIAGGGLTGMFAVNAAGGVLALGWTWIVARRASGEYAEGTARSKDLQRETAKFAFVVWISFVLSLIVWRRSEFFFLEHYSSDAQIAVYSIAYAIVTALLSALEAIATVVAPAVALLQGAGHEHRIQAGFGRGMRLLLVISLPITAGAIAVGPSLISVVYGSSYSGASTPMIIMLCVFPVLPIWTLATAVLWGLGRVKFWLFTCLAASVVNFALDFALIPGHGATGAAWANVGAQLAAGIPIIVYTSRVIGRMQWYPFVIVRAAGAAAGAGIAGWLSIVVLGDVAGVIVGPVLGTVTFVLLACFFKIFPASDREWLRSLSGKFGGERAQRMISLCVESGPVPEESVT